MYHYVYVTRDPITGFYYKGMHSTPNLFDGYQGSGRWVKAMRKEGRHLETTILSFHGSAHDAYREEARLVTAELLADPKCKNLCLGGRGRRESQAPHAVWARRDAALRVKLEHRHIWRDHKGPRPYEAMLACR